MELNEREIIERIVCLENRQDAIHQRIDHIEGLVESVNKIGVEMQYMRTDLNKLVERMSDIESKPAKRLDTITVSIISAIISFVAGFVLPHFIGGG